MKKLLLVLIFTITLTFTFFVKINAEEANQKNLVYDLNSDVTYYTDDETENKKLEENLNLVRINLVDYLLAFPAFILKIDNNTNYTKNIDGKEEIINENYSLRLKYQDLFNSDELRVIDLVYKKNNVIKTGNKEEKINDYIKLEQFYTKQKSENELLNIGYITRDYTNNITENSKTNKEKEFIDYELTHEIPQIDNLLVLENIPFIYGPYKLLNKNIYKNNTGYTYRDKDLLFIYDEKLILQKIYKYNIEIEDLTKEQITQQNPQIISRFEVSILKGNRNRISNSDLEEENYIRKIGSYRYFDDKIDINLVKIISIIFMVFMTIFLLITIIIVIHYNKTKRNTRIFK